MGFISDLLGIFKSNLIKETASGSAKSQDLSGKINYENLKETDKKCHLKGQPFLIQHLEDAANLNHKADPEFVRLTAQCATGNGDAMYALADWFEMWSRKEGASLFYIRAANYWRYRAYRKGNDNAVKWFAKFFDEHPGERLESILYEQGDHFTGWYKYYISGTLLNDLGFDFFDPKREYNIDYKEGKDVVVVSAYHSYESPDEDGFGAEDNYAWWFLDENMQEIPGVKRIIATFRERNSKYFRDERTKAEAILKQQKTSSNT